MSGVQDLTLTDGLGSSGWSCFQIFCAANSRFSTEISNSSLAARSPYIYHFTTTRNPGYAHGAIRGSWRSFVERRVIACCDVLSCLAVLSFPQAHEFFLTSSQFALVDRYPSQWHRTSLLTYSNVFQAHTRQGGRTWIWVIQGLLPRR